jgi:hypothetical protein
MYLLRTKQLIMKRIAELFMKIMTDGTGVSSKRFSGLVTLLNLIILAYITTVKKGETPEYVFDTLALLAASFLGLTTLEKIFVKKKNESGESN